MGPSDRDLIWIGGGAAALSLFLMGSIASNMGPRVERAPLQQQVLAKILVEDTPPRDTARLLRFLARYPNTSVGDWAAQELRHTATPTVPDGGLAAALLPPACEQYRR